MVRGLSKVLLASCATAFVHGEQAGAYGDATVLVQQRMMAVETPASEDPGETAEGGAPKESPGSKLLSKYGNQLFDFVQQRNARVSAQMEMEKDDVKKVKNVTRCEEITSSLLCSKSKEKYGIKCKGWGGSKCLDESAECADISNPGICGAALLRLNMTSCAGWSGSKCIPHFSEASVITDPDICENSEERLGITSMGWGGSQCLDDATARCERITSSIICSDAKARLGIDCLGWSGTSCLGMIDTADCDHMKTKAVCTSASKRFGFPCVWQSWNYRCANPPQE